MSVLFLFSLLCCFLWLTDHSFISSCHLLCQLYLGALSSWIPPHISAETTSESLSLIPLVKIFILQKTSHFLCWVALSSLLKYSLPPIERTRFMRPKKPTKLTRLSNFSYQISCRYRRSILKNNANFGFRVWKRTPSVGLSYESDRVRRLMSKSPKARVCCFTVGVGQGSHWCSKTNKVDVPATTKLYNQWMVAGKTITQWSWLQFWELIPMTEYDFQ